MLPTNKKTIVSSLKPMERIEMLKRTYIPKSIVIVILWFIIRNIYTVFVPITGRVPKTSGISCEESNKGVFCYVDEVSLGKPLRIWAGCLENQSYN